MSDAELVKYFESPSKKRKLFDVNNSSEDNTLDFLRKFEEIDYTNSSHTSSSSSNDSSLLLSKAKKVGVLNYTSESDSESELFTPKSHSTPKVS